MVIIRLLVAGSGSNGNTYLLQSDSDVVVLDCGINFKIVMQGLDFDIRKIRFAVCSHIHGDHMTYVREYLNRGIKVLMPKQVKDKFSKNSLAVEVKPLKKISIDGFYVTPFEVPHDEDVTCFAYIIEHEKLGKLLYMTDCMYCKYNLSKQTINHFLVECNYTKENISENYKKSLKNRVMQTHMELNTTKEFIRASATDELENIILCHLSEENANPMECVTEIRKVAKNAYVDYARAGLELELRNSDKCPF